MSTPRATYRLQFNRDFTFADAAALAPYLAELGISHLYASPWLKARAGSRHGYDIIDHNAFNPELGGQAGFERLYAALARHGLGHLLDFVPNHMGIAQADNAWWLDVLAWGRASPYANWFDIDWSPADPRLNDKVLLPLLGDHYGKVLESGELTPKFDPEAGNFSVWYHEHRFPLAPASCVDILAAGISADAASAARLAPVADALARLGRRAPGYTRRAEAFDLEARLADDPSLHPALARAAAALAGTPGEPATFLPLHRLLERQHYRLAYWRVAADEINYRRFFDINDLAGIRVEERTLFDRVHKLVAQLLDEGKLDGLRIDHIDGLFDPAQYCRRLRRLVDRPFYLVVEKVLARHERLRDWPVDGTTGYDFLNQVNALLVDASAERDLARTYQRFTGRATTFDGSVLAAKQQVIETQLSSELHVLARALDRLAERNWRTRDYTRESLADALGAVVAAFPVYRTYVDARGTADDDRRDIAWAVAQARRRWDRPGGDIFDFIEAVLTGDLAGRGYPRRRVIQIAMRVQQYTSPVMAKGFEDTTLYRYHLLTGLNDVGGDPRRFALSVAAFHHANHERAIQWPHAMLTTATHDTKRGEDTRARLAALSSIPREWAAAVTRFARLNRRSRRIVERGPAPDRNDEYLLYQTLLGTWPNALDPGAWDRDLAATYTARIQAYMTKAQREAKVHSSWVEPNAAYEQATSRFIARILDPDTGRVFLDALAPLAQRVAAAGVHNSLVQLALKLTCPGVPDIYQGCELWDLSLVDPDNRRPVDFALRQRLLQRVRRIAALPPDARRAEVAALRSRWTDGAIKLYVLHRLLQLRARHAALFAEGGYTPVEIDGGSANGAIAFARTHADARLLVIASLHAAANTAPGGSLRVPDATASWTDMLTGARIAPGRAAVASLLDTLPVTVLIATAP